MRLKALIALGTLARGIYGDFAQKCTSLADSLVIENSTVITYEFIAANSTLQFPNADPTCGRPSQLVSVNLCRVSLNVSTSDHSGITLEAWLPENWSGRFLSTGNGGLGGCVQFEDIEYAASLGFAAVGTNNGHNGMTGESFLNNADVIEDFAYRALHTGVVLGKQISAAFYGCEHTKSYYLGCSTGGRQGMKEAQAFPDDFDGIVAGAPAMAFNNLTSWSCHFLPLNGPVGSASFVGPDLWTTIIFEDILKQCDGLDGVTDGILEAPDRCDYNPEGLTCSPTQANSTNCLTTAQVQTVRSVYSSLLDANGDLVYPRMQPGAEQTGMAQTYFTGQPFGAADWFKYAIFNDSNWDPATLKPADYLLSSGLNLFNIETFDGDLSAFNNKGGKLLHYHGLADGTISSDNSPRYYEHVSDTMGLDYAALDDFYRYFRISGMAHCGGGPGAANIGNGRRQFVSLDPQENVLTAIVKWVEEGVAPDTITGTAWVNGTQSAGVAFKRNHCRWPLRNEYQGAGDPNDAESWKCV